MDLKKNNNKDSKRYLIIAISFGLIITSYLLFLIRYIIPNFPFLFSLDDIFWEMGIIFFLKYIFFKNNMLFYISAIIFTCVMLLEEYSQKYLLNNNKYFYTTYSFEDIIIYILGFILAIFIIKKITKDK